MLRPLALLLVSAVLLGQEDVPETTIRATVNIVQAPTTVLDKDGRYVSGLELRDFRLYDNDKLQNIALDVSFQPISLVVAVQTNSTAEGALPAVQKIGSLLEGLVLGEQGEAALVAFDHRVRVMQEFTSDPAEITKALKKLTVGASSSRMTDAVIDSVRMLRKRPPNRRRIILLISETRDYGSEAKAREALTDLQLHNVIVYPVNMSRFVNRLTAKTPVPRPDPMPPAARPLPPGAPQTPTSVAQISNAGGHFGSVVPLVTEIFRSVKAVFVDNPQELYTKYTGGREFSFVTQKGLEEAISAVGEELHSQYLLSYNPNNKIEGGFHRIHVVVNRPDLDVRTRGGYWMAGVPE